MGVVDLLNKEVAVSFNHDLENKIDGTIVKQDVDDSVLIRLSNGNLITDKECHYSLRIDQENQNGN